MKEKILKDEECFHDEWASGIDLNKVLVDESFELPTAPECQTIMKWLGNIEGKRILDLGSGAGEAAIYFAKKGADVTATDLSGKMLEVVKQMAIRHETSLQTAKCSATDLPFEDEAFDIVYGANVLHHVDTEICVAEALRVLKPGGEFVAWDPLKHNPVINIYRHMANEVRTDDEEPLNINITKQLAQHFSVVRYECFWLSTLLVFIKFFIVDRIHPNKERYWKKIIYDYESFKVMYNFLHALDRKLLKIFPILNRYCWNIAIYCKK